MNVATVIQNQESLIALIGDLLSVDINALTLPVSATAARNVDLLGDGLDVFVMHFCSVL